MDSSHINLKSRQSKKKKLNQCYELFEGLKIKKIEITQIFKLRLNTESAKIKQRAEE